MPRLLPRLDRTFADHAVSALGLVQRIELAHRSSPIGSPDRIRLADIELAYEMAYLRVYMAWEVFLEEALLRLMCGYAHSAGQEPLAQGCTYFRRLVDAEAFILNGQTYRLWHDPNQAMNRAARLLNGSRYEQVIASATQQLERFAKIRHRIAHSQADAATKFDATTMAMTGRRYPASRPGRFLRDWKPNALPPVRWIEDVFDDLEGLASQICA